MSLGRFRLSVVPPTLGMATRPSPPPSQLCLDLGIEPGNPGITGPCNSPQSQSVGVAKLSDPRTPESSCDGLEHSETPATSKRKGSYNDTILTPFSLSPMTDMAVDSLPKLFLAYCTLADSDDVMSDDDWVVPQGSDLDPVPLLTGCALGLSPSFLSCSRQWSIYRWRIILRPSVSVTYLSLSPYAMIHLLYDRDDKPINRLALELWEP
jgi:hypothetical protein